MTRSRLPLVDLLLVAISDYAVCTSGAGFCLHYGGTGRELRNFTPSDLRLSIVRLECTGQQKPTRQPPTCLAIATVKAAKLYIRRAQRSADLGRGPCFSCFLGLVEYDSWVVRPYTKQDPMKSEFFKSPTCLCFQGHTVYVLINEASRRQQLPLQGLERFPTL